MLQVWSISYRISMTLSLLYQLYQAILFWIRLSLHSDWHGVWAVFIIIIFIIVIASVVVMIIIIIIIVVVLLLSSSSSSLSLLLSSSSSSLYYHHYYYYYYCYCHYSVNNIPYQCDITCAGHFTLDALASRTVACLEYWTCHNEQHYLKIIHIFINTQQIFMFNVSI